MKSHEIESKVLELAAEDAHGSWELWWKVSADVPATVTQTLREQFIDTIDELVKEQKLITLIHRANGRYEAATFDRARFAFEIDHADKPNPDEFYWFETKNEKMK